LFQHDEKTIVSKLRIKLFSSTTMSVALLCCYPLTAFALPEGGVVSAGNANITVSGDRLDVVQGTEKTIIDWRGFDIGAGQTTEFHQPSANALAVNRVNSPSATQIDGALKANGNVVIINENGVAFGKGAKVDVNSLIATTANSNNETLLRDGVLAFDAAGNPDAAIVNEGEITAKEAGLVGLVAPNVINSGKITAKLGRVQLGSGDTATVDLYGDGLMQLSVSDKVKSQLVANAPSGSLHADGGTVAITAAAGREIVNSLIAVEGDVRAQTVSEKNGRIIISAAGSNAVEGNRAADKGKKQGSSTVLVAGVLDASGRDKGERGGSVSVFGDNIALLGGTVVDVSGDTGKSNTTQGKLVSAERIGSAGGSVKIGGDYLGQGSDPTAKNLYVDKGAYVLNDSLTKGDAGRSIFWSDDTTDFKGKVFARALGGKAADAKTGNATPQGNSPREGESKHGSVLVGGKKENTEHKGNGGFVETSGHKTLDAGGYVDLTASNGDRGTYFLDPTNITIYGNVDPAFQSTDGGVNLATNLKLWLDASDTSKVNLTYSTDALSGATVTGAAGATTLTTSVDVSSNLAVGARIRLGAAGAVTAANTVGADTYTITNIAGTTLTLSAPLSTNYNGGSGNNTLHRGLVSQLTDKSGVGNDFAQLAESNMPLWISNGENGLGVTNFDGNGDMLTSNLIDSSISNTSTFIISKPESSISKGETFKNGDAFGYGIGYGDGTFDIAGNNFIYLLEGIAWLPTTTPYGTNLNLVSSILGGGTINNYLNSINIQVALANPSTPDLTTYFGGSIANGASRYFDGSVPEGLFYDTALTTNPRNLVEQYQSAKWGIGLDPLSGAGTEVAEATASIQKGNAADGYSVFTTRYLERLSQSADISLQASNDINLDLKGDTLNFTTSGRSLSLTAGNQITTASAGNITTNNGAINLTGTNGILFSHAVALNSGTAATTLTSTNSPITFNNALTLGGNTTVNAGTGTITAASTIAAGANNLTLTSDDVVLGGNVSGTGTLTLQPSSTNRVVRVNQGAGDFDLSAAEIGRLVDGWNRINIGDAANNADMHIGNATWSDPITFKSNFRKTIFGFTGTNNASFTVQGGWMDLYNDVTTAGGIVDLSSPSYIYAPVNMTISSNGGNVALGNINHNDSVSSTLSVNSLGGNIDVSGIYSSGAASTGSIALNAGTGNASITGTANGGSNLSINANNISLSGSLGNSSALGAVSLSSTNSLSLPSITASSILARATGATSDITIPVGRTLTATGAGNALTLAAGRNIINNAGASALSTPSGRWLLYSTNPTDTVGEQLLSPASAFNRYNCTYTLCNAGVTIPAAGNGLIYSFIPTLNVTGVTANPKAADGTTAAVLSGGTLTGLLAGDTGVTLNSSSATGVFADAAVGTGKAVTASGYGLAGTNYGYALTQPTGITGDIYSPAASGGAVTALPPISPVVDIIPTPPMIPTAQPVEPSPTPPNETPVITVSLPPLPERIEIPNTVEVISQRGSLEPPTTFSLSDSRLETSSESGTSEVVMLNQNDTVEEVDAYESSETKTYFSVMGGLIKVHPALQKMFGLKETL
jgi:filamentous hemagglutinin family protein